MQCGSELYIYIYNYGRVKLFKIQNKVEMTLMIDNEMSFCKPQVHHSLHHQWFMFQQTVTCNVIFNKKFARVSNSSIS